MIDSVPFRFGGTTYHLAAVCTFEVEAAYSTWLVKEAYEEIQRSRDYMDPADYAAELEGFRHDKFSKSLSFGGILCDRSLFTEAGVKHMAWLLMKKAEQPEGVTVGRNLIDAVARDKEAWDELQKLTLDVARPFWRGAAKEKAPAAP